MSKLDEMIKEALQEQDQAILDATQEQGWFALGISQFRGKLGWVTWSIMLIQGILFIAGVWCAISLFTSSDVLDALKWGLSAAVLMIIATQLKLSLMPQMQADRILREMKRLELILMHKERKD